VGIDAGIYLNDLVEQIDLLSLLIEAPMDNGPGFMSIFLLVAHLRG
jgi:hypothetical protein